jgi:hypothetical protein
MTEIHGATQIGLTVETDVEQKFEPMRELDANEIEAVAGASGYIGAHGRSDDVSPDLTK